MPTASLSGVRVLIVEDEMMVSMLLEDMLTEIGCTPVGPATRVESALELVESGDFDVAILDVNLNGNDSYPIADALAEHALPFVFASGYSAEGLKGEYRAVPSLRKPFQQQELEKTLSAALRQQPGC